MPCTKADFVNAINSYAAARTTGDPSLIQMSAEKLSELVDTLTFAEVEAPAEEVTVEG